MQKMKTNTISVHILHSETCETFQEYKNQVVRAFLPSSSPLVNHSIRSGTTRKRLGDLMLTEGLSHNKKRFRGNRNRMSNGRMGTSSLGNTSSYQHNHTLRRYT